MRWAAVSVRAKAKCKVTRRADARPRLAKILALNQLRLIPGSWRPQCAIFKQIREQIASPWWQIHSLAAEKPITPTCTETAVGTTTCICGDGAAGKRSADAATLSQSTNTVIVQCQSSFSFVPSDKSVCNGQASLDSMRFCTDSNQRTQKGLTPLADYLTPSVDSVQWQTSMQSHSLTFPSGNFPLSDRDFFVGCKKDGTEICLVNVHVKARQSRLTDSNTLVCAYGADSNSSVSEAVINFNKNSLTVDCGADGEVPLQDNRPIVYHCTDPAKEECKGVVDFKSILPGFSEEWLTVDEGHHGVKLVIPEGGFPTEPKTIVLGCNRRDSAARQVPEVPMGGSSAKPLPLCRVKVTLKTHASSAAGLNFSAGGSTLMLVPLVFAPHL
ncbi:SAG-related sequence [Besnoitia besnoiti]|uniref:SAG-related sequence n=1 Tax=Besnoitia besnoiti TaxID=94643 RepID=A0A2A9MHZ0_BESBE|nr:SAG-related sequence [Besnoitia besnoiti]PFH35263.1 SAG-related sequence [Besnoitia besnoiti]